jgi:hypothetical protein
VLLPIGRVPRELIRYARRLLREYDFGATALLPDLCAAIVQSELASKRDATLSALARLGPDIDVQRRIRWLAALKMDSLADVTASSAAMTSLPAVEHAVDNERGDAAERLRAR